MSANKNITPEWWHEFLIKTRIAHGFVLHFNTSDYVSPEYPFRLPAYLTKKLSECEIVAVYSLDRGITFPLEAMQKKAVEILSDSRPEQGNSNPALAAIQAVGLPPDIVDNWPLSWSPNEALPMLDKLLRIPRQAVNDGDDGDEAVSPMAAVIIERAELIVPDADLADMSPIDRAALATMARWGTDQEIEAAGNMVILVVGNLADLHRELRAARNKFEAVEVSLPNQAERSRFIERYLTERQRFVLNDGLSVETVANAMAGLSLVHVEDILLRAEEAGVLSNDFIWERKQSIVKTEFGDVLEIFEPRFGFDNIGGLQHVKDFFIRNVIRPIREGRKNRVPMGVLMTGPAGTGKSLMAEAVAREAGINAVQLRLGGQSINGWPGESERNLAKALRAIVGLAPTIVFIDEIDQAIQRGDGETSSPQEQRIFQRLLEFMADTKHRGDIVFLAASNRPDYLDPALSRPGRFDKKIPFLVPDRDERKAIFSVTAYRYLRQEVEVSEEALNATEGWSGAEIEVAMVKAAELIEDEQMEAIQAICEAVQRLSLSTTDIELMTFLAIAACNDCDLLPPKYRQELANREVLDQKIQKARASEGQLGRRRIHLKS
jgi:transitional endoplasmic reticulum ATPase